MCACAKKSCARTKAAHVLLEATVVGVFDIVVNVVVNVVVVALLVVSDYIVFSCGQ